MPFVTLVKRSGYMRAKSLKNSRSINCECSFETPFTFWLATIARCAMRTCLGSPSSISDIRRRRSPSPGQAEDTR